MFAWEKDRDRLDVSGQRVLRLQKSLNDVQVALPGLPAQPATAYLCAFTSGAAVEVVVALHLHTSDRVAFYREEAGAVPPREAGSVFSRGIQFAESMGFMLGDLDFQQLPVPQRVALWESLPVKSGNRSSLAPSETPPDAEERAVGAARTAGAPARDRGQPGGEKRKRILENLGRFLASL